MRGADKRPPMTHRSRQILVIIVTAARLPLAAAAAALLAFAGAGSAAAWAALGLLLAVEVSDAMDGVLARRLAVAGRFGELFDPYCDSIARLVTYSGLAWAGLCPWWLVLVMAVRDVSVAYIRIMCVISGRQVAARLSGKLKAVVQGLGAVVLAAMLAAAAPAAPLRSAVAWGVSAVTAWSLVDYFAAALRQKTASPPSNGHGRKAQAPRNA